MNEEKRREEPVATARFLCRGLLKRNPFAKLFQSMVEFVRAIPRQQLRNPESRIPNPDHPSLTPEQFRQMLEEALAADPNLARRVLMPLAGTVFPIGGGVCNTVEWDPNGSKTQDKLTKWSDASNCKITDSAVIEVSGKVGIGTPTPNNRLEVAGTTFNRITASVSADVQTGYQWKKTGANATDWEAFVPAGSTALRFYNAGDRMTLLANGNLGIGTTNPGYSLEVNGSINIAETGVFRIGGTGVLNKGASANDLHIGGGFTGYLALFSGGGAERIRIKSDGKVGIGTTDPKRPLHVKGGDIIVEKGGGFGLIEPGNADPNTVLYRPGIPVPPPDPIPEGVDITILRTYKNEAYASPKYTILKIWAPPNAVANDREATLSLTRGDNDEESMDVYNNGYSSETQFGIRIQKRGSGSYRDFVFDKYDGSNPKVKLLVIKTESGNVGIGDKATPAAKLDVSGGDIYVSDAGKGIILKNAAGTICRRVRLNDAGDGLIFDSISCP